MKNASVYGISLAYPEDMLLMTEEEILKYFRCKDRWAVRHSDRHFIVSVSKTRGGGLLSWLTDSRSVANGAKRNMRMHLKQFRDLGDTEQEICGQRACGYDFEFMAIDKDILQSGSVVVFRKDKCYIAFLYCTQADMDKENRTVFEEMLQSIRFE